MHLCDWLVTFVVGLGGGNATDSCVRGRGNSCGLPVFDGLDMWPWISGAVTESPRKEVVFTPLSGDDNAYYIANRGRGSGNDPAIISEEASTEAAGAAGGGAQRRLWKLIMGRVAQASWEGPQYPNGTRSPSAPPGQCVPGVKGCWHTWLTQEDCSQPAGCSVAAGNCTKIGCLFDVQADPLNLRNLAGEA